MTARLADRLDHIVQAIGHARNAMVGKTARDLEADVVLRAAFERFMEIISEASRYVPADMKACHPDIPWADIANFGNHLRHACHRIDARVLWSTYRDDLAPLDEAVRKLRDELPADGKES